MLHTQQTQSQTSLYCILIAIIFIAEKKLRKNWNRFLYKQNITFILKLFLSLAVASFIFRLSKMIA